MGSIVLRVWSFRGNVLDILDFSSYIKVLAMHELSLITVNVAVFALYIFFAYFAFLKYLGKYVHHEDNFSDTLKHHLFLKREF